MNFLERYYEKNKKEAKEVVESVARAILELAPHFGVYASDSRWGFGVPRIRYAPRKTEAYGAYLPDSSGYMPIIVIVGLTDIEKVIGHEAGHFMHQLSFPSAFKPFYFSENLRKYDINEKLKEGVAYYSSLILTSSLTNPKFNLIELAGMDLINISPGLEKEIKEFCQELRKMARGAI